MGTVVMRVGVVALLALAATTLWIRRIDHRNDLNVITPPSSTSSAGRLANVVVATRRIYAGDMIEPTFIGVARRAVPTVPDEAFSHVDNVMGRVARVSIDAGEVITNARLAGPFAPKLDSPHANRTMMLRVDSQGSDASVETNSIADLLIVPGLGDPDRTVETILEGVRVVYLGSALGNRRNAMWYPVTAAAIEVTSKQQERLATALVGASPRFALRRHVDNSTPKR